MLSARQRRRETTTQCSEAGRSWRSPCGSYCATAAIRVSAVSWYNSFARGSDTKYGPMSVSIATILRESSPSSWEIVNRMGKFLLPGQTYAPKRRYRSLLPLRPITCSSLISSIRTVFNFECNDVSICFIDLFVATVRRICSQFLLGDPLVCRFAEGFRLGFTTALASLLAMTMDHRRYDELHHRSVQCGA